MTAERLAAAVSVLLAGALLAMPSAAAQSTAKAVLPPQASTDCAGDVPVAVASDVHAQSDIYAAALLAASIGTDCIVLAGPRDQAMPADQIARLNAAAPGGYVIGGATAVPASKPVHREGAQVVGGSDRWETIALIGQTIAGLITGETKSSATVVPSMPPANREPGVVLAPQASTDCAGDVPVAVASDVHAQSDIYAAALLAASIGTDCIVLAGPRDQAMPADQIARLNAAAPGGYVVGGATAVPASKPVHREGAGVVGGSDRWQTIANTGQTVRSFHARSDNAGGTTGSELTTVDYEQINGLLATFGTLDADRDCPESPVPGSLDDRIEVIRIADGCVLIEFEQLDGRTLAEARRDLARDPAVVAADLPIVDLGLTPDYAGGDPEAGRQWHLPQVDARSLWDGWPEGVRVTVAVIDSGVDSSHPDLDDNVVIVGHACHRRDSGSHGTHVAGIALAESGNQIAVAGVAPRARLLPIKLPLGNLPTDGDCAREARTLPQAIKIAVENGADVINMSLGLVWHRSLPFPTTLEVVIHLATTSNVVMVAAAGNRGQKLFNRNAPEIPAMHPDVISVAATARNGQRAVFSTSNRWVDIAAQGDEILSTIPCVGGMCGTGLKRGTSMAAPVVSGVVAHMKARYPDATPAQIRQALYETALQPGSTQSSARTYDFGWGMIQPQAAIEALGRTLGVDNAAPRFFSPSQRRVAENTTEAGAVTAIDQDDAVAGYSISGGADRDLFTVNSAGDLRFSSAADFEAPTDANENGVYEVDVRVTSGFGTRARTATQSILVTVTDVDEPPAAPDAPSLSPATRSIEVAWTAPGNTGPPIDDYDLQYRAAEAPDETLGTREWTEVGRDVWNIGCDIWRDSGGDGREIWDDLWDDAGKARARHRGRDR